MLVYKCTCNVICTLHPTDLFSEGAGYLTGTMLFSSKLFKVWGPVGFYRCIYILIYICATVKSRYIGDGHPTFNRNPYNGYINPYYWVDEHPLLYGNNGSLDPGTYIYIYMSNEKKNMVVEGTYGIILPSHVGIIINHYKDSY